MGNLMNIGYGNLVNTDFVLAIISPDSAPAKRLVQNAKENGQLIDATQGKKTKSVIVTTEERIIISALQPDTLSGRFQKKE